MSQTLQCTTLLVRGEVWADGVGGGKLRLVYNLKPWAHLTTFNAAQVCMRHIRSRSQSNVR